MDLGRTVHSLGLVFIISDTIHLLHSYYISESHL